MHFEFVFRSSGQKFMHKVMSVGGWGGGQATSTSVCVCATVTLGVVTGTVSQVTAGL